MWKGGGAGEKNMNLVTLGTGVGGGVTLTERCSSATTEQEEKSDISA